MQKKLASIQFLRKYLQYITEHELDEIAYKCICENPWFTKDSVKRSLEGIIFMISEEKIEKWLKLNPISQSNSPKNIGLVLAGNIPAVGFHDLICVFLSSHIAKIKPSHQDKYLISLISSKLNEFYGSEKIIITEKLQDIDAIIATGSDNSARYFNYYFGKYPNIIRSNRTSVSVISENEPVSNLKLLADDVFTYYGLGCRNVSKLFIPKGFDLAILGDLWQSHKQIINQNKYANNYDVQKSLNLINRVDHKDFEYLIVKASKDLASPISVLYYEEYDNLTEVNNYLKENKDKIQCVVSSIRLDHEVIPFGKAQQPELWDYADGVNTIEFLNSI
ncbi:MAG: acyl-CoA reductase [Cyclobacteriaceae bacterium]|nr:acyl-CoA reductase [Cyclobacteriaceae bacterium]